LTTRFYKVNVKTAEHLVEERCDQKTTTIGFVCVVWKRGGGSKVQTTI